jgi:hypothetical protein
VSEDTLSQASGYKNKLKVEKCGRGIQKVAELGLRSIDGSGSGQLQNWGNVAEKKNPRKGYCELK